MLKSHFSRYLQSSERGGTRTAKIQPYSCVDCFWEVEWNLQQFLIVIPIRNVIFIIGYPIIINGNMLGHLLQGKQNAMITSNHSNNNTEERSFALSQSKYSRISQQDEQNSYECLERLRVRVYEQQKKNKKVYDEIVRKNPHFGYRLTKRSNSNSQHIIIKEHQNFLKEYAFLHNQLTKIQCITSIFESQNDPFRFLIHPWSQQQAQSSNQEKINRINKNVIFLKNSINEITQKNSYDSMEITTSFIHQSKEYRQLKQLYEQAKKKIAALQGQRNMQLNNNDKEIDHLKKNNKEIQEQKEQLLTKIASYQQKTKQLITQVSTLSMNLMEKQRQLHQLKIDQISQRQDRNRSERSVDHSISSRSSLAEEDKENILADLMNQSQQNQRESGSTPFTSKKYRPIKNREILFSECKGRNLFSEEVESVQDKSLRFIRRK